ncbi:LysE family translocator [Kushneria indalinina]|uniref:Threonine/homoserine/homoserine lactone efflux protein n=1 Tax=Kushneria indalinina DSM 14324 TaxID=1122140 RepID=A0A3D9DXY5_9GAMM|nr:LysE family translocator [Kushneria indalinina]REC95561.1 threonine/homoserine/homoserine lactone efflux protein [Kushneria indalinina DSM 14324]
MSLHLWLAFFLAYLLVTLSPGPNVLLVIRNGLRHGVPGVLIALTGNLIAQLITIALVALGIGTLLSTLPVAFTILKVIGAAYLMFLGSRQLLASFRKQRSDAAVTIEPSRRHSSLWLEAFLVSISNPKTLLFLSAFLPQFIDHAHGLTGQFAIMYLTIAGIVITVHSGYVLGVKRIGHYFSGQRWKARFNRLTGMLFIGMGLRLLGSRA